MERGQGRGGRGGSRQSWANTNPNRPQNPRPNQGPNPNVRNAAAGRPAGVSGNPPPNVWANRGPNPSSRADAAAAGGRPAMVAGSPAPTAWGGQGPNLNFLDAAAGRPGAWQPRPSPPWGVGGPGQRGGGSGSPGPRCPTPDPTPSGPESLVPGLHQLELSTKTPAKPLEGGGKTPITRPDAGGTDSFKRIELLVNHFKVEFRPTLSIFHYDINIMPEKPLKPNAIVRVSKSDALWLKNKLFSEELSRFPLSQTAYDGEKNIFSRVELPTGKYSIQLCKGEDVSPRTYVITIQLVNKLELHVLDAYLKGREQTIPRDVLQAMDIIMREHPSITRITMGKGFYSRNPGPDGNIGYGIFGCRGFKQSLKPTSQGPSLCIDYSVMPFHKPINVLDFLKENMGIDGSMQWNGDIFRDVEKALKRLSVTVTHRRTSQKFPIVGLTSKSADCIEFDLDEPNDANLTRKVTLVEYFRGKYGLDIKYKHLPCLNLSKNKRINYVPMEFCILIEGQRFPKDNLPNDADKKLRSISLVYPADRKRLILGIMNAPDGPCGGEIARQFGITVSKTMTQVPGRVLSPPDLKLRHISGECSKFTPEGTCQYNFLNSKFLDGKPIRRWGILDFSQHWSTNRGYTRLNVRRFYRGFIDRCKTLGIQIEDNLFYEKSSMDVLSNPRSLSNLLQRVYHQHAGGHLQILLCPMAGKHEGYRTLKRICETEIGIMTQCCLSFHANKCQDQYLVNLALKINAKLGGSNMELYQSLPNLGGDGHVMFMGADVNHPGGLNAMSPSITAVAATMNWPAANRYASRLRAQRRGEKILHIGAMCSELVEAYARINNVKPGRILFFRDGVSESQFDMVLNEELIEIRKAIESDGYKPTITFIVAQKRHLTRFFPRNERDSALVGKSGNIPPGTVVDKIVIHPNEFDFYLNSHYGILGTSKPTHYHTLQDDHGFSSDQLQRIIYNLCFTFPRCTKPISLVPLVYYADLVAYRGRLYYDSLTDLCSPASTASSCSSSSSSWSASSSAGFENIIFPKVHSDLENQAFCM